MGQWLRTGSQQKKAERSSSLSVWSNGRWLRMAFLALLAHEVALAATLPRKTFATHRNCWSSGNSTSTLADTHSTKSSSEAKQLAAVPAHSRKCSLRGHGSAGKK